MIFEETKLAGAYIIELKKLEDERGFFARAFCQQEFESIGLKKDFVQANISHNKSKGTLRGLHLQIPPYTETKLVRCTRGSVYDVIVDMRKNSPTYCQWMGVHLSADNFRMLYVPDGFAHSYITLEDHSDVLYQVSQFYAPGAEKGFRWDDPAFNIEWPIVPQVISQRDMSHPLLQPDAFSL